MKELLEILSQDSLNTAEAIDSEEYTDIVRKVIEGYEDDLQSRQDREEQIDENMKLATQVREDATYPWPGAASVKFPLLTEACVQFASRAYPALVNGVQPVRGRVVGYDHTGEKTDMAIRVGKHMSYQLLEEMESWEEDMDRLLMSTPIVGSMFKKTYFDPIKRKNASDLVSPKDLVVDYFADSLEGAYRKTHVISMPERDVEERMRKGVYLDIDLSQKGQQQNVLKQEVLNIHPPSDDSAQPRIILEQHTFEDLDGDGYEEPYIITVDYWSEKLLRIVPRFDVSDIEGTENEVHRIEPIEYFTKFGFIPNPVSGIYDLGYGDLVGPINETVNTTINQLLDAGHMSNLQAGFIAKGIRIKGGDHRFRPGEWKHVQSTGDDLRKSVFPLPTREPSSVLFQLLGLMIQSGERLSSTVDSMVGENPGQNQKATTTQMVMAEGMRVFNGIYKRLHRALKKEYKKLYRLNSQFLPVESYFTILDPLDERPETIRNSDYNLQSADVVPSSDPNVATQQQKLAKAGGLLELINMGAPISITESTKRILEAQEQPGIEQLMDIPPPQPSFDQQLQQQEFEDGSMQKWTELRIEASKSRAEILEKMTAALENVAKAEAEESGNQLGEYKQFLENLQQELKVSQEQERLSQQQERTRQQREGANAQ